MNAFINFETLKGLTIMIIFIPINVIVSNKKKKLQVKKLKYQDTRIKLMNEILAGIRVIKFMGWESAFKTLVNKIRNVEINYLIKSGIMGCFGNFTWDSSPFLVSAFSFGIYISLSKENNLYPDVAFVSLSLFEIIKFPLTVLPMVINGTIQVKKIE
jgi:ATP-binding cassette, subfamily C (CFTR/MRP), member 1